MGLAALRGGANETGKGVIGKRAVFAYGIRVVAACICREIERWNLDTSSTALRYFHVRFRSLETRENESVMSGSILRCDAVGEPADKAPDMCR